jgi:nitrite reductase/ring-hydroxylating ferredoxin subunit
VKRYVVARTAELPVGGRLIVEVNGKSIGIFNVDGTLHAVLNRCPHQGAELCKGIVIGGLSADVPGEFRFEPDRHLLVCPWHGWEFDLADGRSYFDPKRTRVRAYAAEREAGAKLVAGPYVAEKVEVSAEADYVVVRM